MTDQEVLNCYIDMVPFLGQVLGPSCEIIVHDLSDMQHSLVAMCNGVSGRQLGNPITDLAQEVIEKGPPNDVNYLANYIAHSKSREFISSTFFIKNEGRLIGMLCINKDMTAIAQAQNSCRSLLEQFNLIAPKESEFTEDLENPMTSIINAKIAGIISQSGQSPERMNIAEKIQVVHRMREDGITMMKGAIPEIARQLGISVPTVYRYMNKDVKNQTNSDTDY